MIDVETMIKALRLAWIPRLFAPGRKNWKTIPDYYLGRYGGLSFLLRCYYCTKYIDDLPSFYKDILVFFNELKKLHNYDRKDMILFNNKEILVGGKPIFIREWFNNNILFIQDLLNSNGQFMSFQEFKNKLIRLQNELPPILSSYKCNTKARGGWQLPLISPLFWFS